eukprot:TRINITY_DN13376_c0_g1_i2.p1 TRINITY_DN13376_c0_g1~~TRINITY_DN13376_c0_g1_i2.p1  ORF type:complete len:454 (-),score=77.97 TRINITY_DN13376_c0_g1_i2:148-1338(-)
MEAVEKAKLNLDFVLLKDVEKLAASSEPPPLALLTIQAAVGAVGLLPGEAQGLTWDQLQPLLTDAKCFISSLLKHDVGAKATAVTDTLRPFFDREDFRPNALAVVSSFCRDICEWCLALYTYGGGPVPDPAPEATLRHLREARDRAAGRTPDPGMPRMTESNQEEADDEEPEPSEEVGGLRIMAMSGQEIITLRRAKAEWIRADLRAALKKDCPSHTDEDSVYDFVVGIEHIKGLTSLGDLGLDPQSQDGAEVQAIVKKVSITKDAHIELDEAKSRLHSLSKRDIKEVASMATPPPVCSMVFKAMYLIFHPRSDPEAIDWPKCQAMLRQQNFLELAIMYDFRKSPDLVGALLETFVSRDDFHPDHVRRASLAAAGVAQWVKAIHTCCTIINEAMDA